MNNKDIKTWDGSIDSWNHIQDWNKKIWNHLKWKPGPTGSKSFYILTSNDYELVEAGDKIERKGDSYLIHKEK